MNKSFLELGGKRIIDRIVDLCKEIFVETIIITNSIAEYKYLNLPCFVDIYQSFGPLSGIHAGLLNSESENNFILSYDLPFVNEQLINFIIKCNSKESIILTKTNEDIHSVCGIYKKDCIPVAKKLLTKAAFEKDNQKKMVKVKLGFPI